jgi:signal transduction histidine kinase
MHDLRSPITCILGALEMLQQSATPENTCFLEMIRQSVGRMHSMTDEVMDFSKGVTRLNVGRVCVEAFVSDMARDEESAFANAKVELATDFDAQGFIEVDRTRIQRVILNLLKNAREAISGGGKVTLSLRREGDFAVIGVTDTGCGIPQERLAAIFEPFVSHGKADGTGLGLAIAKSVVEAHHGRIVVKSEVGVGSTFEVFIPFCIGARL